MKLPLFAVVLLLCTSVFAETTKSIQRAQQRVPGEYIVVLNDENTSGVSEVAESLSRTHGGRVGAIYNHVLRGFSIEMNERAAMALLNDPRVAWVEENATFSNAPSQTIPSGPLVTLNPPTPASLWYLDRIDQPTPSSQRLDGSFNYCSTGEGSRIYVVDTGVLPFHKEFCTITPAPGTTCPVQNRRVDEASGAALAAHLASNGLGLGSQCWNGVSFSPAASHGTAVASIAAGKTFGSAKGATIVDARAANCFGTHTTSHVIAVLDWIPADANGRQSVVNLSFEGLNYAWQAPGYSALRQSIDRLVNGTTVGYPQKINVVAAAGNANDNTYWYSPASSQSAITVAGLNKGSDTRWAHSNYGHTVVLYAPAQHMESASTVVTEIFPQDPADWVRSETPGCDTYTDHCTSGTSFSAPLTAGVIARYLQTNPGATRSQVVSWLHAESASNTGVQVLEPGGTSIPILNLSDCQ